MKKILAVDNHPVMLKLITNLLEKKGHQVLTAEDGLSALDILKTYIPDVIFIDLVMPRISGEKLCRIIRRMPKMKDVYLIILSAIAAEEEVDFAEFGANACIAKGPFNKMAGHVLSALDQSELGTSSGFSEKIIGFEDISQRQITKELLSAKRHSEAILSNMSEGILELTHEGKIIYSNPAVVSLTGIPEEKLLASNFTELFHENHRERIKELLKVIGDTPQRNTEDSPVILNRKQVSLNILPLKNEEHKSIAVILDDITERKQADDNIKASLREKEVLLKEVHHRVKNNLQVISSLLNLQSAYVKDREALEMFKESQNRVRSMALIHEKLYQSEDLARIDIAGYIRDLVTSLFRSYGASAAAIKLNIDARDIFLDINTSIPCGLIINELVSNSLKHAFPDGREGEIKITMHHINENKIELIVSDNGIGFPEDIDFRSTESLGLQLVISLVEQLDCTIELDRSRGTAFKTTFEELKYKKRM
jgi:PAS domain S-box-containing protein